MDASISKPHQDTVIEEDQEVAIDRISALPDELVGRIVSFLPTLCSMRTSLLSKRWNNKIIWTSLPVLDFDNERDDIRQPTKLINRILIVRGFSGVQIFRLKLSTQITCPYVIDDWICSAATCNMVIELDLQICGTSDYGSEDFLRQVNLRPSFFMCKTLKVLRLRLKRWDIKYKTPSSKLGCLPCLKTIHVTIAAEVVDDIILMHGLGKYLIPYCPVLEELTIVGDILNLGNCDKYWDRKVLDITSEQLKMLRIEMGMDEETNRRRRRKMYTKMRSMGPKTICLRAPKLEKLYLKNVDFDEEEAKSLSVTTLISPTKTLNWKYLNIRPPTLELVE